MSCVYLGLGSNVDARRNIHIAIEWLQEEFLDAAFSPVYQSPAVGFDGEDFLNLVARVQTHLDPIALKHKLNRFEDSHGRKRNVPKFCKMAKQQHLSKFINTWISHDPVFNS